MFISSSQPLSTNCFHLTISINFCLKSASDNPKYTSLIDQSMSELITENMRQVIYNIATAYLPKMIPLRQTQALIVRPDCKLDRLDAKLMKEVNKLNNKERSKVKHQGCKPNHRRGSITYKSYTIEFKKKLVTSIREQVNGCQKQLSKLIRMKAKELGIHPKNITRWYHTKELKKKEGGRRALYPQMEHRLALFIVNNPNLRRKHILKQAKQIMEDLQIPGREDFNFSKGWYQRFRDRLNKCKILNSAKLEDGIKYEVKLQNFQNDDDQQDYCKKEEQEEDYDVKYEERTFVDYSDSEDEEQVKYEEESQDRPMIVNRTRSSNAPKTRAQSKKQWLDQILNVEKEKQVKKDQSLYFQQQEEAVKGNISKCSIDFQHNQLVQFAE